MAKKIIGIDLGGTTVKFAILTLTGEIQQKWSIPTNILDEGSHIVPDIIESINHHLSLYDLKPSDFIGIGMGTPGSVDREAGTVIGAYNLNWKTLQPVREQIEKGTGIKFTLDNDANVAALGERWQGAGDNNPDVVFVTLGTGVGGGVIMDGNLLHGKAGCAGEIGHVTVDPHGFECTCGKKGCLVANDNDPLALKVVDQVCYYLGLALGNIGNTLNPANIVIGGGVSAAGEFLRSRVEKYFREFTFPQVRQSTEIKLAQLGNDAGVIGAASLALQFIESVKEV
ncbi:ROK family protein [Enterococcus cecorum]|uniref:ROK family protein n=1 Tax=Enterococcus cecorum TaxID=44008 RepID=UPI0032C47F30